MSHQTENIDEGIEMTWKKNQIEILYLKVQTNEQFSKGAG